MEDNVLYRKKKIRLTTYLKLNPPKNNSLINYSLRAYTAIVKTPGLEKKIIEEVKSGEFSKNSLCGAELSVLLCSLIPNKELKEVRGSKRRLKKGAVVGNYVSNTFKELVQEYIKENEEITIGKRN